jgi:type I restriction enzyme R subunit
MEKGTQDASGDQLGKTVIFARTHKRAVIICERLDHNYQHLAGKDALVIVNQISYAQSLIEAFSLPDSELRIAISVDMLETGIDVPEVVNLVFCKREGAAQQIRQSAELGTLRDGLHIRRQGGATAAAQAPIQDAPAGHRACGECLSVARVP